MPTTITAATAGAAHADPAIAARRYTTTDQLFDTWLTRDVPVAVAQELLAYAAQHGLELSDVGEDCYPLQRSDGRWLLMITWPGLERICRATGCWMPGRSIVKEIAGQILIEGSCHVRFSTASETWVEVSDVARFASHFQRDLASEDLEQAHPQGEWALIPEIKLADIALYRASLKALGDIVGRHEIWMKYPAIQLHAATLQQRRTPSGTSPTDASRSK